MRDIRQDLKERIEAEYARREPLAVALEEIENNIAGLKRLLQAEEDRASGNGAHKAPPSKPSASLEDYLMKMLSKGPKTLQEMRAGAMAAGYFHGSKESPGRAIHGKLLNPLRAKTIVRDDDRKYRLVSKD